MSLFLLYEIGQHLSPIFPYFIYYIIKNGIGNTVMPYEKMNAEMAHPKPSDWNGPSLLLGSTYYSITTFLAAFISSSDNS